MSQARLPRTEPSTELISAHKVNHRALMWPDAHPGFSERQGRTVYVRGAAPGGESRLPVALHHISTR